MLLPGFCRCCRLPTRKYIDASRIILQGTCRRVVSPTGTSTLLKTREFGVNISQHQRRSVEMQLPESRILVHIEILGVPQGEPLSEPPPAEYSPAYFTGPQFLSEHREEEPYTAADAAVVIRQRIADQFRHVWGNARVVLGEIDNGSQEVNTKASKGPSYIYKYIYALFGLYAARSLECARRQLVVISSSVH